MSLQQLSVWCEDYFGSNEVIETETERPFDITWMVLDSTQAERVWEWAPRMRIGDGLREIAIFAEGQKEWCKLSALS